MDSQDAYRPPESPSRSPSLEDHPAKEADESRGQQVVIKVAIAMFLLIAVLASLLAMLLGLLYVSPLQWFLA